MALLSCQNLSLSYDSKPVLSGVSFSVEEGQWLCIVGENGSGKSTLVKALLHLKKPDSGEIVWEERVQADGIGYLPQQTQIRTDFPASALEIVLSGVRAKTCSPFVRREQREKALAALEKLGARALAHASFASLSGGERQRVLLARALLATNSLLVLDEPLTGLDPLVTHELYHLIRSLNREGMTVIMVSHDVRAAVRFATHILHLNRSPVFCGTAADYEKSEVGRVFLSGERHV